MNRTLPNSYTIFIFQDFISRMFLSRRIMVFSYKINNNGLPNNLDFTTVDK